MRTTLAIFVLAVLTSIASAEPWANDDDFVNGSYDTVPSGMTSDGTYVYVLGTSNNTAFVRRRLLTAGATWEPAGSFTYSGNIYLNAQVMTYDSDAHYLCAFGQ